MIFECTSSSKESKRKDFKKIFLKPGESKVITFKIDNEKLSFYNEKLQWITQPGSFDVMIGSSSADIRLKQNFELIAN